MRLIPILSAVMLAAPLYANGWGCANCREGDKRRQKRNAVEDPEVLKLARKRIDDLQDEVLARKIKEAKCENAVLDFKEKLRVTRERGEMSMAGFDSAKSDIKHLRKKLLRCETDREEMSSLEELSSLRALFHEDEKAKKGLEEKLKRSEEDREMLKENLEKLEVEKEQLDGEKQNNEEELNSLSALFHEERKAKEGLEERLKRSQEDGETLKEKLENLEVKNERLDEEKQNNEEQLNSLRASFHEEGKAKEGLEEKLKRSEEDGEMLKGKLETLDVEKERLDEEKQNNEEQLNSLRALFHEEGKAKEGLEEKLKRSEEDGEILKEKLEILEVEKKQLDKEKKNNEEELNSLRELFHEERKAKEGLEERLKGSEEDGEMLKEKLETLEMEKEQLDEEKKISEEELKNARVDLENERRNVGKMEEIQRETKEKLRELKERLSELSKENTPVLTWEKNPTDDGSSKDAKTLKTELELAKLENEEKDEELRNVRVELEAVVANEVRSRRVKEVKYLALVRTKDQTAKELRKARIDLEAVRVEKDRLEENLRAVERERDQIGDQLQKELSETLEIHGKKMSRAMTEIKTLNENIASRDVAMEELSRKNMRCEIAGNRTQDAQKELNTLHANFAEINRENQFLRKKVDILEDDKLELMERVVHPSPGIDGQLISTLAAANLVTIVAVAYLAYQWGRSQGLLEDRLSSSERASAKERAASSPAAAAAPVDGDATDKTSTGSTAVDSSSSSSTYGTDDAGKAAIADSVRDTEAVLRRRRLGPVVASISDFEDDGGTSAVCSTASSEEDFEVIPQNVAQVSDVETLSVVDSDVSCANGEEDEESRNRPLRLYIRLNNSSDKN